MDRTLSFSLTIFESGQSTVRDLTAVAVNVSDLDMDITTDYPLEQGHILRFHEKINGHNIGLVQGVKKNENSYTARIRLK